MRTNGVTLENILQMDCMKNSKLISGTKGIKNTVSKANIMADPFILDWVEEGELLLMTAYSLKKEGQAFQKRFIKECSDKGLSGIGIKVHPYMEALPKELLDFAEELNFPIIELYYETPFSDIMVTILKEIFNKQASLLQRLESVHEQFMDAMLQEASAEQIASVIKENIKNPVYVRMEFPEMNINKLEDVDPVLEKELINDSENFYQRKSRKNARKLDESRELISDKYVTRMVMPIVVKENVYGHIFSWAVHNPLGGFDLSVLESGATTMALEILKQLSVREVEDRYRSEFLDDLLSENTDRKYKALERASFFQLNQDEYYAVIKIDIDSHQDGWYSNNIYEHLGKILQLCENTLSKEGVSGLATSKRNNVYLLLALNDSLAEAEHNEESGEHKHLGVELEKCLQKRLPDLKFRIGVGRPFFGLQNARKSHLDAERAVYGGDLFAWKNSAVNFDDLGIYKILCQNTLQEELERFYISTVKPLRDYDKQKSTELIKTLEEYFRQNGNLKQVSKALYTHYNTVLYRIERIKSITGLQLENTEDSLNIKIGLKIMYMLENNGTID